MPHSLGFDILMNLWHFMQQLVKSKNDCYI